MTGSEQGKWTPGKWTVSPKLSGSENHKGWNLSAGSEGGDWKWIGEISPMSVDGEPSDEGKANAALIAAAPELFELLEFFIRVVIPICRHSDTQIKICLGCKAKSLLSSLSGEAL